MTIRQIVNTGGPTVADDAPVAFGLVNQLLTQVQTVDEPAIAANAAAAQAAAVAAAAAQTTANTAQTAASTAQTTATTASSTATAAQTTANAAQSTAGTANTNASTALTTANTAQSNVTALSTTVAGLGGAQKIITVSAYAGVDKTGTTSSLTAWNAIWAQAATNYAAGLPTTIVVDCPTLLSVMANGALTMFHPANVNIRGTPDGMLIIDNLGIPGMFFCNVSNITWQDLHVRYNQPASGTTLVNSSNPNGWSTNATSFQTQYLGGSSGYLHTVNNVTYSGGSTPIWSGSQDLATLFNVRGGVTGLKFINCTFDVPPNANPAAFIYQLFVYTQEFLPNQITVGPQQYTTITWSAGVATVTLSGGGLSAFTTGSTYYFYVNPKSSASNAFAGNFYCTKLSSTQFSYSLPNNPGTYTATSGQDYWGTPTTDPVTAGFPSDVTFDGCTFDGIAMCHVKTVGLTLRNCTFKRYTDLQDGTNGTITFASAPTNGATSATLASAWTLPTATYWAQFTNGQIQTGQIIGMKLTNGQTTATNFIDPFTGNATNVIGQMIFTATPTTGATSGTLTGWTLGRGIFQVLFSSGDNLAVTVTTSNPYTTFTCTFSALTANCTGATQTLVLPTVAASGWVGSMQGQGSQGYYLGAASYSAAPPHAVYCGSASGAYPTAKVVAYNNVDYGLRVFNTPTGRANASGTLASFKAELGKGTTVVGWTSFRPDGGFDLQSFGSVIGSTVRDCTTYFNSGTASLDFQNNTSITLPGGSGGGPMFGMRMPGPSPYGNTTIQDCTVVDANPYCPRAPFLGTTFTPNQNVVVTGLKIQLNDWKPYVSSTHPIVQLAGTNCQLEVTFLMNSMSTGYTGQGYVPGNSTFNQNSDLWIKWFGWRAVAVTLAAPITGATSATLSSAANTVGAYVNGWPFATGVYKVFFYDNSVRYVTFTANLWTMTWTNQATVGDGVSTTGITAQGLYYQGYSNWKPRLVIPTTYGYANNRLRLDDYTNGLFMDCTGNMSVEEIRDEQVCYPPAGTSFTTQLQIFGSMQLTALGICVVTSLGTSNGLTGFTVGYSGSNAALFTCPTTNSNNNNSNFTPASLASIAAAASGTTRTITITAVGGTGFDGTGAIYITFRATQQVMQF